MLALEAQLCCLVVLSTPGLPASLYLDELLGRAVALIRHHLAANVLPMHDARFKRGRPAGADEGEWSSWSGRARVASAKWHGSVRVARARAGHVVCRA